MDTSLSSAAAANVLRQVDVSKHFPDFVFTGRWRELLFFDPSYVFQEAFTATIEQFLSGEASVCACLCNLDEYRRTRSMDRSSIFLERGTDSRSYLLKLNGGGPATGWVFRIDSYVCTSDVGKWCMYLEKGNDIGVLGIAREDDMLALAPAIKMLNALPLPEAFAAPVCYAFAENVLTSEWKEKLSLNYKLR